MNPRVTLDQSSAVVELIRAREIEDSSGISKEVGWPNIESVMTPGVALDRDRFGDEVQEASRVD